MRLGVVRIGLRLRLVLGVAVRNVRRGAIGRRPAPIDIVVLRTVARRGAVLLGPPLLLLAVVAVGAGSEPAGAGAGGGRRARRPIVTIIRRHLVVRTVCDGTAKMVCSVKLRILGYV